MFDHALVANAKEYAVMRATQDEEHQELHEAIEYMNERQGKLLAMMERKKKLMSGAPEHLRGKIFQDIRVLDESISAQKVDLLEKTQAMKELLKERWNTEVKEWRDTVVAGCGVTRRAVAGSRSSETEADSIVQSGSSSKRYGRDHLVKSRRRRRKEEQ